jgi:hypothetical protein
MMMRRVQTAAGVSGGGEGASDVLDDRDASDVIFVSCNASAILARRREVLGRNCCPMFYEAKVLLASRVNFVFTPPPTAYWQD